ncbi:MAG TPA: hypothetical protein VF093_07050 [Solirubrobacterales bacterium]
MRRSIAILSVSALLALGLGFPQGASATVKCQRNPNTRVLSVTVTRSGPFLEEAVLHRVGTQIRVFEFLGLRVECRGNPTVTNTDQIKLYVGGLNEVTIGLNGGPLAPGATPEPDGSPEIEITARGSSGTYWLNGGAGADHFRYMSEAGRNGLNLNTGPGDEDLDLLVPPMAELYVEGRKGPDTIDVAPPVDLAVTAFGEAGDDILIGGPTGEVGEFNGALLEGGAGRDRIIGSPLFDLILPGAGADVVRAEGGADAIQMGRDRRRDRIDCGAGRDGVGRLRRGEAIRDPFDRFRSCERISTAQPGEDPRQFG